MAREACGAGGRHHEEAGVAVVALELDVDVPVPRLYGVHDLAEVLRLPHIRAERRADCLDLVAHLPTGTGESTLCLKVWLEQALRYHDHMALPRRLQQRPQRAPGWLWRAPQPGGPCCQAWRLCGQHTRRHRCREQTAHPRAWPVSPVRWATHTIQVAVPCNAAVTHMTSIPLRATPYLIVLRRFFLSSILACRLRLVCLHL